LILALQIFYIVPILPIHKVHKIEELAKVVVERSLFSKRKVSVLNQGKPGQTDSGHEDPMADSDLVELFEE
jgi:hypothetical protein